MVRKDAQWTTTTERDGTGDPPDQLQAGWWDQDGSTWERGKILYDEWLSSEVKPENLDSTGTSAIHGTWWVFFDQIQRDGLRVGGGQWQNYHSYIHF